MKQKVCRAFGYVIIKNEWDRGDVFSDDYCSNNVFFLEREVDRSLTADQFNPKDFNHVWLITDGKLTTTNVDSGDVCVREAGFCTVDVENQKGSLQLDIQEPTTLFCLSANRNLTRTPIIPNVKTFKLGPGETYTSDSEIKLFLAAGELHSGVINAEGPCQLQIGAGGELVATTQCYGLLFLQ
jgi:hypothetical protein